MQIRWVSYNGFKERLCTLFFYKITSTCRYVTEVQGIKTKWDKELIKIRSDVYIMTPRKTMLVTHAFVKKLQTAKWSTEEPGTKTSRQSV